MRKGERTWKFQRKWEIDVQVNGCGIWASLEADPGCGRQCKQRLRQLVGAAHVGDWGGQCGSQAGCGNIGVTMRGLNAFIPGDDRSVSGEGMVMGKGKDGEMVTHSCIFLSTQAVTLALPVQGEGSQGQQVLCCHPSVS